MRAGLLAIAALLVTGLGALAEEVSEEEAAPDLVDWMLEPRL